jgi:hypothetical protein
MPTQLNPRCKAADQAVVRLAHVPAQWRHDELWRAEVPQVGHVWRRGIFDRRTL